jgi:hypothetical protein
MTSYDDSALSNPTVASRSAWGRLGRWPMVATVSLALLLVTFNPILTALLPYLFAGWPAVQTAFWLKAMDPWKARGTVGLLFHLCMAGFLAAAHGTAWVFGTIFLASLVAVKGFDDNLILPMIAIGSICFGCFVSSVLGWIGIVIALRHGVRVFVKSNLYRVCRGDFQVATTLTLPPDRNTNPANFIVALAVGAPVLVIWCVGVVLAIPPAGVAQVDLKQQILMSMLLILPVAIIAIVIYLAKHIIARSPAECWGAELPLRETVETNWYRVED